MSKLYIHIGKRVGNVVAIGRAEGWQMLCECDCGKTCNVQGATFIKSLNENRGLSCGCIKNSLISKGRIVHGITDSPTMRSWSSMLDRCYTKNHKSYKDYGGRGIKVCEEWRKSFSTFYAFMGLRPIGTTLGRIDNEKGYFPDNCEWQTNECQANNRRSSRKITFNGECKTLSQWSKTLSIPRDTLSFRLKTWDLDRAFTTPVKVQKNNARLLYRR